ncbi:MAG TPA: ABC transporter permease, partial [Egibacteraceae bacterium]|nr:ABC transporter permease [Egibacteraceae bacterium]
GMSLLMAGTEFTLYEDGRRIVRSFGADAWVVAAGTSGPFTTSSPVPAQAAEEVAQAPGVKAAEPVVIFHSTVGEDSLRDINVIGYRPGSFVAAPVTAGRELRAGGETVADVALGVEPGDVVSAGGHDFVVVGVAEQVTWYFGTPTLFVALDDAQAMAFRGQPLAMGVATTGVPAAVPAGLRLLTNEQVVRDLERPLESSTQTIALLNLLLWLVAAGIIGSMIYLSALERSRDFAVFKATGGANRALLAGLLLQAVVLSTAAAIVATVVAWLLRPAFPFTVEIPTSVYLRLLAVVLVVGLVASLAGLRRAVKVQPALAFGGG